MGSYITKAVFNVDDVGKQKEGSLVYQKNQWVTETNDSVFYNVLLQQYGKYIKDNYTYKDTISHSDMSRMRYRPKLYCYEHYNCVDLFHILLFVNNMTHPSQFNRQKIVSLSPSILVYIERFIGEMKKEKLL